MAHFSASKVQEFVRNVFLKTPNFGELTTRQLRNQYQKAMGISSINEEDKDLFRSVVNTVFQEFTSENDLTTQPNKESKQNQVDDNTDNKMKISKAEGLKVHNKSILETVSNDNSIPEVDNKESIQSFRSQNESKNCESIFSEKEATDTPNSSLDTSKEKIQEENLRCSEDSDQNDKSDFELEITPKSSNEESKNLDKNSSPDTACDSSSSEDFHKTSSNKKTVSGNRKQKGFDSVSEDTNSELDEIKPSRKRKKSHKFEETQDSDAEVTRHKKQKVTKEDSSIREKKKTGKKKATVKEAKLDRKIEQVKKYLRAASIHVQSYSKLWEGCDTQSDKVEKLMELLHDAGLEGAPTLEKCKKLRLKREQQQELASLDTSNIISAEGRGRRNARSLYQQPAEDKVPVKTFSRLKGIVDSEESD